MFEKMVRTQTAKQERTLEEWLRRHDSENPFPADVSLTKNIDYLGDGKACHRMDLYRPANCALYIGKIIVFSVSFVPGRARKQHFLRGLLPLSLLSTLFFSEHCFFLRAVWFVLPILLFSMVAPIWKYAKNFFKMLLTSGHKVCRIGVNECGDLPC